MLESRSFTADEALQGKLIDFVAPNLPRWSGAGRPDGPAGATGRVTVRTAGAEVRRLEVSPLRELLGVLADPNIAYILLRPGLAGAVLRADPSGRDAARRGGGDLSDPRASMGCRCCRSTTPGLALIVLAVVFFILEIKITSYGMLTVAGVDLAWCWAR